MLFISANCTSLYICASICVNLGPDEVTICVSTKHQMALEPWGKYNKANMGYNPLLLSGLFVCIHAVENNVNMTAI